MLRSLSRFYPRLLFLGILVGLGYWARNLDPPLPSQATGSGGATAASSLPGKRDTARKIGEGKFFAPQALVINDEGILLALDSGNTPALRRFYTDGREHGTQLLPAPLSGNNTPNLLAPGARNRVYLARTGIRGIWELDGDSAEKVNDSLTPASMAGRHGVLYVLGYQRQGITRLDGQNTRQIALSQYPSHGYFSRLHVRANGDFYLYADEERLVWRFNNNGKLLEKIGGGGESPPQTNLTADYIGRDFDIGDNGDVYWTLGNYGTLLKIDAHTGIATSYSGRDSKNQPWIGNFGGQSGFVVHNGFTFVFDRSFKSIIALPLNWATPGAPGTKTLDTRAFGLGFRLESKAPYKVFTTPLIQLRAAFTGGNRKERRARLTLTVRDFNGNIVATPAIAPAFKDGAPVTIALPVFRLPQLGWYQIEAALFAGDDTALKTPLLTRVHYVTRTVTDPALPIPAQEHTGWDDLQTPRMAGMRLHRYSLHRPSQIDEFESDIRNARKIGYPYFTLLINKRDCTPENARAIVEKLKAFGDEEPLIELINEPNLNMSARAYVELLRPCREAIKQANPRARILGPVQCGVDLHWLKAFFRAGGGELIDAVSVHTYERHNSMDAAHWNWKFTQIQELLKEYHCEDKPLYQTEHGFLGDYGGFFVRPQWQANQLLLEKLVLDRFGIDDSKYFYYYVNESGYRESNSYIVNRERELLPAAAMMRVRRHLLQNAQFVRTLDFAIPGNRLLTGNLYRDGQRDVIILQNNGALAPVEISAQLPGGARLYDCWGNALPVSNRIAVGRAPLYLHLPRDAAYHFQPLSPGHDIAPLAKITVNDAKGQQSVERLTNGQLEFDFFNQPIRVGFLASDGHLPLELTLEWDTPRTITGAILYASLADNDKSTPLAYELFARRGNAWHKIAGVDQKPQARAFNSGNTPYFTDYENPWIFRHLFNQPKAPVVTDALRFRFKRTTYGHYPTQTMVEKIGSRIGQHFAQRVELREIEVYSR